MNGLALRDAEQSLRPSKPRYQDCGSYMQVPATSPELLEQIRDLEATLMRRPQPALVTEHLFHAGMYARTVRLVPGSLITGALIQRATLLIVNGRVDMLLNDGWAELDGYNVIPASAGRKQVFVARGDVAMTMMFPTAARTVEEAEAEVTVEADLLLSNRQDNGDTITITGE
jgi:hypothetical protein